ncbi:unnamed protein product [Calicophoron daubneyi]|uniref:Uncharacterized protein n=1 Tax=Calicophoron daubneyi TaxID=300641 RepID=A0AAV2U097_CALDB
MRAVRKWLVAARRREMSTDLVRSTADPESPGSGNSPHSSATDSNPSWLETACTLLESRIKDLLEDNAKLAAKSAALSACLVELLTDVSGLSSLTTTTPNKELSHKEWLTEQLLHFIQQKSSRFEEVDDYVLPTIHSGTSPAADSPSGVDEKDKRAEAKRPLKPAKEDEPEQKQKRLSSTLEYCPPVQLESGDTQFLTESDSDEEQLDTSAIRAAFRLFAKHIGPSLKREHRSLYGAPPTQTWLADQLLARWDSLGDSERRSWYKRVCSS